MSSSYLFVFGRTPKLSFFELTSFFPKAVAVGLSAALVEADVEPPEFMHRLGGTVKIAKVVGFIRELSAKALVSFLLDVKPTNRLVFGVSLYGPGPAIAPLLAEMKTRLAGSGVHVRFLEGHGEQALGSVVISKQNVVELVVVKHGGKFLVGRTVAVQPFEEWNRRDYGRPYADPKSGMLPPKVARMVVNIAFPYAVRQSKSTKPILLDPFCGMATILAEALLTGWTVIGSDQSAEVIKKAEANLRWLSREYPAIDSSLTLYISDATHISEHISASSVDGIVTEPFMGDPQVGSHRSGISGKKIKNIVKGLEKLYIGCLKDWHTILTSGGKVVMALPEYHVNGKKYFVKKVIDSAKSSGYTTVAGPIEYSRPQAIVRREFYIFKKKG